MVKQGAVHCAEDRSRIMSNTAERQSPSLTEFGQTTAIIAPFLYIIGQKYAAGYFNQLGCTWVAGFLTFQETLNYALPTSFFVLLGAFLGYVVFSHGASAKTQLIIILGLPVLAIVAVFVSAIFWDVSVAKVSSTIISVWLCMLFGFYSVEAVHTFKQPQKRGFKEACCWVIGSAFTVYNLSASLGSEIAESDLKKIETRFPKIAQPGVFGVSTEARLIAKVGEKFLIMETSGDTREFYLKSNLDALKILPMTRPL